MDQLNRTRFHLLGRMLFGGLVPTYAIGGTATCTLTDLSTLGGLVVASVVRRSRGARP